MSDETSAAIRAVRGDWVSEHRETYLTSGGARGHIENLTAVNGLPFSPHCLIRYKGRKTGKTFIAPLCYSMIGGEVVICASKGGAEKHPAWYINLVAVPTVDFQIGTQAFRATWREPQGEERQKIWDFMVECFPFYATYQASTARVIPLVMLKATADVPVFRPEDADGWRD